MAHVDLPIKHVDFPSGTGGSPEANTHGHVQSNRPATANQGTLSAGTWMKRIRIPPVLGKIY